MPLIRNGWSTRTLARLGLVTLATLALAACGGGGGGGGGGSGGGGGGDSGYNTAEFRANYGLGNIRVLNVYEAGYDGTNQVIAVIDTGVDVDHPDLDGKILAASRDVPANSTATLNDTFGHGTNVAGVALAEKNSVGMHGVAWGANLLALRADAVNPCDPFAACFRDDDLAAALNYARLNGATVINMSLGGGGAPNANFQNALRAATNAGIIVVIAAGNAGGASPEYPARFAMDAQYGGLVIAVGATNSNDVIANFSNRAGVAANNYVVAPGVSIYTTAIGGGYANATGTSFSAPHVAGAIALLRQRFPASSAAQIVNMLFNTARDLGAAGTDTTYGRGLIDLASALAPLGILEIPTGDGGFTIDETRMWFGAAFGDAMNQAPALANMLTLDALGRDFQIDARASVQAVRGSGAVLESVVVRPATRTVERPLGYGRIGMSYDASPRPGTLVDPTREDQSLRSLWMQTPLPRGNAGMYWGATAGRGMPSMLTPASPASRLALPQLMLAGSGTGAVVSRDYTDSRLTFAWHQSADTGAGHAGHLGQAWLQGPAGRARYAVGLATVGEEGALFRSTASGAFGRIEGTSSQFLTLAGALPVSSRVSLFATATGAQARPETSSGLLSNWDTVVASAFAAGVRVDRLTFTVGQPLRVERASADLTVPVALRADGTIATRGERIDLTPSGRELTAEVAYDRPLGFATLGTFLGVSRQPDHVVAAPLAGSTGMRLRLAW